MGAFIKKPTDKLQVIHDLSWPPGTSVNDGIDKNKYSVKYSSVVEAVSICQGMASPGLPKQIWSMHIFNVQ